ncbi:MAG TPA: hypothetical protein VIQ55_08835 [Burkholderiales bacterium]|jgi:hypothetical protein
MGAPGAFASSSARGPARDIVSIDLEFMGETVDEYFVADIPPIDTLQESLLAQIEAGEPPVRKR